MTEYFFIFIYSQNNCLTLIASKSPFAENFYHFLTNEQNSMSLNISLAQQPFIKKHRFISMTESVQSFRM